MRESGISDDSEERKRLEIEMRNGGQSFPFFHLLVCSAVEVTT